VVAKPYRPAELLDLLARLRQGGNGAASDPSR